MPKTQDRLSLEPFLIPVEVVVVAAGNPDPTVDEVQFQFVAGGQPSRLRPTAEANPPATTGWVTGFWETTPTGLLYAGILVGPTGAVELAGPEEYAAWIRIVDAPSIPVVLVDTLNIT